MSLFTTKSEVGLLCFIQVIYHIYNIQGWIQTVCLSDLDQDALRECGIQSTQKYLRISTVKEKWTYPQKNVLVCAWYAKAKMAAPTSCFKNSRSWILTRLMRLDKDMCKGLSL